MPGNVYNFSIKVKNTYLDEHVDINCEAKRCICLAFQKVWNTYPIQVERISS